MFQDISWGKEGLFPEMRDTDAGNWKPEGQSWVAQALWAPREPAGEKEQLEKKRSCWVRLDIGEVFLMGKSLHQHAFPGEVVEFYLKQMPNKAFQEPTMNKVYKNYRLKGYFFLFIV